MSDNTKPQVTNPRYVVVDGKIVTIPTTEPVRPDELEVQS